ncbi:uncharacterized protein LOC131333183 isoform X2 [Rhododendron vialii]|uniref:uncharacterized protein LOC131333183 isoform X2 n=1 Tax=Rhododendron vialii TaxID=182163 RepID=UPI00265FB201|nr:uncharacterized protein LOC131333183 isoform X2 [Rhododendron vialii]
MRTSVSTQPPASNENGTVSQLIWRLKSSFRPRDFERVIQTLTTRDEAARRDACYWKTQHDSMEKKHGEEALAKLVAFDERDKLRRERDLLKDQVARAENEQHASIERLEREQNGRIARLKEDQKAGREREKNWEEKYARLRRDSNEVKLGKAELQRRVSSLESEKEKAERELEECKSRLAELQRRVSSLESEKEKAERELEECKSRFEELNRRTARLEEDTAVLMSAGPAVAELALDGREGRSGNQNLTELLVKEELNCGEIANSLRGGGGSAVGSVKVGRSSHREDGSMVIIEIADSDDEMPTRKRVLSKDDDEDVRPTKKPLPKFLEELTDMPDGSDSSDSGDSSSSGSDIDSKREIARLCRKVSGINYGQLKLK